MTCNFIKTCKDLYQEMLSEGKNPIAFVYERTHPDPRSYIGQIMFAVFESIDGLDLSGNPNISDFIKLNMDNL